MKEESAACPSNTTQRISYMRDDEFQALKAAKKAAKRAAQAAKPGDGEVTKKPKVSTEDEEEVKAPAEPVAQEAQAASAPDSKTASKAAPAGASSSFEDQWLACVQCGADFLFSANEQKFFAEKGWTNAKSRCSTCTAEKKARFGEKSGKGTAAQMRLASTTCYTCGVKGHGSKDCPQAPCYNCGVTGHKSKDCKEPRKNQAGGGVCFKFQTGECTRGDACRFAHVKE